MSLGIVAAIDLEGRALAGRPVPAGRPVQFRGNAILLISGVGPERACLASRILIENGAAALMSWGFACGLHPGIEPGDIVVPERVIAADGAIHETDPLWRERLCSRLRGHVPIRGGTLAESSRVMRNPLSKDILGRESGAVASDMESASVCAAASEAGIPFLVVRAVTDTFAVRVPRCAVNCIDGQGRTRPLRLLSGLLQRPADLPDIIRLGRNFRAARKNLKSVTAHGGNLFCLNENSGGLKT